jgi:hypothetical protein
MLDVSGTSDSRILVYAYTGRGGALPGDVRRALDEARALGFRVIVVLASETPMRVRDELAGLGEVVMTAGDAFEPGWYAHALSARGIAPGPEQQIVLSGDAAFWPVQPLGPALERMTDGGYDVWSMIEAPRSARESFEPQGFPAVSRPWMWTAVRGRFWRAAAAALAEPAAEASFLDALRAAGANVGAAFPASDFPSHDPALHDVPRLLDAGCPFVDKAVFQGYPPYLDRQAILGREIARAIGTRGYPMELVWESLARSTPPKALNSNAGMLEVLHDDGLAYDPDRAFRIAVIVRVTDVKNVDEILRRITYLPGEVDVFVTTTEGISAARLERILEAWSRDRDGRHEVRVTPASPGRDMADFFVACRDILLSDRYDLVVKLHARRARRKTMNLRRYFRRYQFENLLNSPGYTRNVLALFQDEPGLGIVFPPMMHIGYATMGRGWAGLEPVVEKLHSVLGIRVPQDRISPLAPFGGMWVARPAALALLAQHRWSYSDYGPRGQRRYRRLAHAQERVITSAAGELGFHARTILTPQHASISHTALDFKTDELFSTTRGYPVEQIQFLHRAGFTGYGGGVAIARMYLHLNHPRTVRRLRPFYRLAYRVYGSLGWVRGLAGRLTGRAEGVQK